MKEEKRKEMVRDSENSIRAVVEQWLGSRWQVRRGGDMKTWAELIAEELANRGETMADVEFSTLSAEEMAVEFDNGFGGVEGKPFTVWTKRFVLFPVVYDGSESVGSVARHPWSLMRHDGRPEPTTHIGGG